MEASPTNNSPAPRRRVAAKPVARKAGRKDGRIKSTLLLPNDVDFRLTTIAKSQRKDRSQLAALLLDAGLRKFGLDEALRLHVGSDDTIEADGKAA